MSTPNSADDAAKLRSLVASLADENNVDYEEQHEIAQIVEANLDAICAALSSRQPDLVEPSADVVEAVRDAMISTLILTKSDLTIEDVEALAKAALSASPAPSQSGLVEAIKRALAALAVGRAADAIERGEHLKETQDD